MIRALAEENADEADDFAAKVVAELVGLTTRVHNVSEKEEDLFHVRLQDLGLGLEEVEQWWNTAVTAAGTLQTKTEEEQVVFFETGSESS